MTRDAPKKRNHLIWIGVLISVFGLVSYFTTFARFPALRDFPWINIPLVLIGVAVSILGVRRRLSFLSLTGAFLSAGCAALLLAYVFVLSNQLPDTDGVVAVGAEAPAFSLIDDDGSTVSLADFNGQPVVLVFYRGFW